MNNVGRFIPNEEQLMDTRMNITNRCRVRDIRMETGHHLMMHMDTNTETRTDRGDPVMLDQAQEKGGAVMLPTLPNDLQPVAGSTVDIFSEIVVKKCHQISSGNDSYQPFITGPVGANVSDDEQNTDNTWACGPVIRPTCMKPSGEVDVKCPIEGCQSTTICTNLAFPDNSYQPLVTGPVGANVSEDVQYRNQPRNTDNSIGRNVYTPSDVSDVSPDNLYQSLITSPVGANVSEEGHDTGQPRNTENSIGRNGSTPLYVSDVSPDNSYQSLVTSPVGANVSEEGHDTGQPKNTDNSVGRDGFTRKHVSDVSPDNSYQSSVTSPAGANVSEEGYDTGQPKNTDNSVGRDGFTRKHVSDISPDNSYQSFVTSPVGANVSEEGNDTAKPRNTDNSVGRNGFTQNVSDVSPDNSYQSFVTSPVGANVSEEGHDTVKPRNTDNSVGRNGFTQKYESDVSPDNSYQSLNTSHVGANVTEVRYDTSRPRNTDNSIGGIGFIPTKPSDVIFMNVGYNDGEESDGSTVGDGDQSLTTGRSDVPLNDSYQPLITGPVGANVLEDVQDTCYMRNMDPLPKWTGFTPIKPSDVVYMNIDYNESEECEGSTTSDGDQSIAAGRSDVSPNNSYQPLKTGPVGANVLEDVQNTCNMRNIDPLPRWNGFTPIKPSDVVYMNIDYDEFSDLDQNSPSSDSGIHSYDEHWTVLSTESPNSDSNQISESTRSIDISPVQERIVPVRQYDSNFHQGVVNTLQATVINHGSVSDLNMNGYNSDVAAMADFSDEDIEQWEDEETHVEGQPLNQAFIVRHMSVSDLSTDDYNSDVAALDDFSDEDIEPWDDEETSVMKQPSLRADLNEEDTGNITMSSYDYAILYKIPPIAVLHDPDDEFRMEYWRNYRDLLNKAVLLDDMKLIKSDYPDIVQACIFRNRWIILVKKEREDLYDTALNNLNEEEVVPLSEDYYRFKLEEYWTYHDEISNLRNTMEEESKPDARAKVNVSLTAAVDDYDNFSNRPSEELVLSVIPKELDVHKWNLTAIAVPDCMTRSMLFTSGDFDVCKPDIGRFNRAYCLGLCGSSDAIYYLQCARCVDILIWGFRVSCVISIVITWTLISIGEFYKRFDVFDGVWGLTNSLITPGDDILRCLWRTKAYKEISPYVMIGRRAMITCCGIPWRWDNGLFRACCASLDLCPIRISGRFGCLCYTVLSADWMDVQPVDGGPVRMVIWIEYKGDGHSQDGSSDAAPITEVHDISRVLHFLTDCLTGLSTNPLVNISPRIILWVTYEFSYSGTLSLCAMMEGAASADDRSGVTFTAELCVPWDAPEAVVDLDSDDLVRVRFQTKWDFSVVGRMRL